MMNLFLDPPTLELEKVAADVRLPEDPNQWPNEILQETYKQIPYISDFDPRIVMDRVDGERGFGFGHIEVKNKTEAPSATTPEAEEAAGIKEVRIPIVIREGKLCALDLIVTPDSKMLPLTENRLRQAIFRPQAFDITSKTPGDQSMIGQLYPPNRSNFGGAGALGAEGMGKSGEATPTPERLKSIGLSEADAQAIAKHLSATQHPKEKNASVLGRIVHTINEGDYEKFASRFLEEGLMVAYQANHANTSPAMRKLSSYQGWSAQKVAAGVLHSIKPTVMQITKVANGYAIKSASHNMWMPRIEVIDRGQLVKRAGVKLALEADLNESVTMAEGASVDRSLPDTEHAEQISDFGIWKVQTTEGEDLIGYVFPTLLDLDGQPVPVALFTNGSQAALQADIAGVRVGNGASLFEGPPQGKGIFYHIGKDGKAVGTIVLTVHAQLGGEGGEALMAETFDGKQMRVVLQPNVQMPTMADESTSVIPAEWQWMPLDRADDVALVEHIDESGKQAAAREEAVSITIRSAGPDTYSLSGMATEKLAYDQTNFVSFNDAVFLLAGFGVTPRYAQEKLACAHTWQQPVLCAIGRVVETPETVATYAATKTAEKLAGYVNLRRDLVKEAAFIADPMAVDTVLSLGFINPENINMFIASLPAIDESQQKLCELLLAARMGLPDLSIAALERAIRSTEEVYEGLRTLAFAN